MAQRIVILGGGTGGTLMANRLQKHHGDARRDHRRRPGRPPRLPARPAVRALRPGRPRGHRPPPRAPAARGIAFHQSGIEHVDIETEQVHLDDGTELPYDVLVVATGARLHARGDRGPDGPGMEREGLHLLRPARGPPPCTTRSSELRGRPGRAQRGRHADQVPGRAARVLLPRRLVLPRAGHPGPGRDHLRHTARRRLHQAHGLQGPRRHAGREGHRAGDRVQHRRGRRRGWPAHLLRRARGPLRPRRGRSRCTAAPSTWTAHPVSATRSDSCRPTSAPCSRRSGPTSSPSATPPTCRPPRPAR